MNKSFHRAKRIVILSLLGLSVIAEAVTLIFGYIIPAPLAEYIAFSYTYALAGKAALCAVFSLSLAAAWALSALASTKRFGSLLVIKIAGAVAVAADLAIHSYVFLAATGYNWNYLASAAFDVILLVCILFQGDKK